MSDTAPDGITPFRAYRAWMWNHDQRTLGSPYMHADKRRAWTPGVTVAHCRATVSMDLSTGDVTRTVHRPPHKGHCGLYAHKTLEKLVATLPYGDVVGAVDLFGDVLDGPYGFQAERATIAFLYDTGDAARQAADTYMAPLVQAPDILADRIPRDPTEVVAVLARQFGQAMSQAADAVTYAFNAMGDAVTQVSHHIAGAMQPLADAAAERDTITETGGRAKLQRAKPNARYDHLRLHAAHQRKAAR